jgi:hypothetical protein
MLTLYYLATLDFHLLLNLLLYWFTHTWAEFPITYQRFMSHLVVTCILCHAYVGCSCWRKCHVTSDGSVEICEKYLSNRFHSRQQKTRTCSLHTVKLWFTNSMEWVVKQDWIFWSGTFESETPHSFSLVTKIGFIVLDTWSVRITAFPCHSTKCSYITLWFVCGVLFLQLDYLDFFLICHKFTPIFYKHSDFL